MKPILIGILFIGTVALANGLRPHRHHQPNSGNAHGSGFTPPHASMPSTTSEDSSDPNGYTREIQILRSLGLGDLDATGYAVISAEQLEYLQEHGELPRSFHRPYNAYFRTISHARSQSPHFLRAHRFFEELGLTSPTPEDTLQALNLFHPRGIPQLTAAVSYFHEKGYTYNHIQDANYSSEYEPDTFIISIGGEDFPEPNHFRLIHRRIKLEDIRGISTPEEVDALHDDYRYYR